MSGPLRKAHHIQTLLCHNTLMIQTSTPSHSSPHCQTIVVSSTPATLAMMKPLGDLSPPVPDGVDGGRGGAQLFKIVLTGFDLRAVDVISHARQARQPAAIVILDIMQCSEAEAERLIAGLLGADAAVHLLLLSPASGALSSRLVGFLGRCDRMAVLKMPCDDLEMAQMVRVMLAKWASERAAHNSSPDRSRDAAPKASVLLGAAGVEPRGSPPTILAVEDDETICWMMGKVLETRSYRVLSARNADDAWQLWRANINTIKLVITDINMPGSANGLALGQAIQDEDGSVPVIYTSGNRAAQDHPGLRAGANYLVKPFRMDDLLDIVARALATQSSQGLATPSVHTSLACSTA